MQLRALLATEDPYLLVAGAQTVRGVLEQCVRCYGAIGLTCVGLLGWVVGPGFCAWAVHAGSRSSERNSRELLQV